jgi:type III secretion system chaperone SycN
MIEDAVQKFCQQYGLSGVSMEEGASLNLNIDGIGTLQLVHKAPHFLIGLHKKVENLYLLKARKILAYAHFKEPRIKPLHTQLHNDMLGFYFIFEEQEIDPSVLSNALDALTDLMDQVFQNL